jgi:hypothetical protein
MPNTLRRIVVGALFLCVLAAVGQKPAAASVDNGRVKVVVAIRSSYTTKKPDRLCREANALRKAVIKKYTKIYTEKFGKKKGKKRGKRKPGLDICRYSAKGGKKPSHAERVHYRDVLYRYLHPPVVVAVQTTASPTPVPSTGGGSGTYCGLFQFNQKTWEGVGGIGSPCAASSTEQWNRARLLQQQRGNQPWPRCGAGGASLEQIVRCESSGNPAAVG